MGSKPRDNAVGEYECAGCIGSPTKLTLRSMPGSEQGTGRTLIACGLWLHMGFAGATAVVAGLLELLDGEAPWLLALTVASLGCVFAIACWRRAPSCSTARRRGVDPPTGREPVVLARIRIESGVTRPAGWSSPRHAKSSRNDDSRCASTR